MQNLHPVLHINFLQPVLQMDVIYTQHHHQHLQYTPRERRKWSGAFRQSFFFAVGSITTDTICKTHEEAFYCESSEIDANHTLSICLVKRGRGWMEEGRAAAGERKGTDDSNKQLVPRLTFVMGVTLQFPILSEGSNRKMMWDKRGGGAAYKSRDAGRRVLCYCQRQHFGKHYRSDSFDAHGGLWFICVNSCGKRSGEADQPYGRMSLTSLQSWRSCWHRRDRGYHAKCFFSFFHSYGVWIFLLLF